MAGGTQRWNSRAVTSSIGQHPPVVPGAGALSMPEVFLNSRALGTRQLQPQAQPGAQACGFGLYLLSVLRGTQTPPQGPSRWSEEVDDGVLSLPPSIKKGVKRNCVIPPMRGMLPGASDAAEARVTEERAASFGHSSPHLGCVEQRIHQASHLIVACFLCSFLHLLRRASIHSVPDGQQATRVMRTE